MTSRMPAQPVWARSGPSSIPEAAPTAQWLGLERRERAPIIGCQEGKENQKERHASRVLDVCSARGAHQESTPAQCGQRTLPYKEQRWSPLAGRPPRCSSTRSHLALMARGHQSPTRHPHSPAGTRSPAPAARCKMPSQPRRPNRASRTPGTRSRR